MRPTPRRTVADIAAYRQGKAAPTGAVKLSSNECSYPPLPAVQEAITAAIGQIHRYPNMAASDLLDRLAQRHDVDPDQIAIGAGSVEVASQLIHAMAGAGDEVIFPWRSFEAYPSLVRIAGATPVKIPLNHDARLNLHAMLAAITDRTRVIFVCNPNNPTGTTLARRDLEEFVEAVPRNVLVVIDEAYVHFDTSDAAGAGLDLFGSYPHVATLRTFSKAYGLAGLRVGYAIAPAEVVTNLRKVAIPFGVTNLAQTAAQASLDAEDQLQVRIAETVVERRRLFTALHEAGWQPVPSEANFIWVPSGSRTDELDERLRSGGVIARAFAGEGIRITVGTTQDTERIAEALSTTAATARGGLANTARTTGGRP